MKDITAVTGKYTDGNGQEKAEFTKIGVIGVSGNGKEYVILDPAVSLSGVLMKQNTLALQEGKQAGKSIICSVFERTRQQPNQQQGYQQQQQQGYSNQGQQNQQQGQQTNQNVPDDDIPF